MSAYYNVQVGVGPQHKEFRKEILQTMQVGVGLQHLCEIYLMPIFSTKFLYFVKHLAYHESARYFVVLTMHVHFYFGEVSSDV
ncbi:nitrogen regulation protein NIFR3 [Staphylococcus aureus]|nr:nitrogen regulation protein NIFR3 [Staphylococcus aureus]